jgi:hypothetical protein
MGTLAIEKKLFVSLRALEGRLHNPVGNQTVPFGTCGDFFNNSPVFFAVPHYPSLSYLSLSHLKLGLYQGRQTAPPFEKRERRGYNQCQRNKGGIGYDQINFFINLLPLQGPDITALEVNHTGILLELPGQLSVSHIDGIDPPGTPLQQAVGKPAGGRPDVHNHLAPRVDVEKIEGPLQFHTTTTDVRLGIMGEADGCLRPN